LDERFDVKAVPESQDARVRGQVVGGLCRQQYTTMCEKYFINSLTAKVASKRLLGNPPKLLFGKNSH
jgi:hypothetical protein